MVQAVGVLLWVRVRGVVAEIVEDRHREVEAVGVRDREGVRVPEGQEEGDWLRLRVREMEGEPVAVVEVLGDRDGDTLPLLVMDTVGEVVEVVEALKELLPLFHEALLLTLAVAVTQRVPTPGWGVGVDRGTEPVDVSVGVEEPLGHTVWVTLGQGEELWEGPKGEGEWVGLSVSVPEGSLLPERVIVPGPHDPESVVVGVFEVDSHWEREGVKEGEEEKEGLGVAESVGDTLPEPLPPARAPGVTDREDTSVADREATLTLPVADKLSVEVGDTLSVVEPVRDTVGVRERVRVTVRERELLGEPVAVGHSVKAGEEVVESEGVREAEVVVEEVWEAEKEGEGQGVGVVDWEALRDKLLPPVTDPEAEGQGEELPTLDTPCVGLKVRVGVEVGERVREWVPLGEEERQRDPEAVRVTVAQGVGE